MERVGLGKGAMCELTREHCVVVMEEVRNGILTLEADLADKNYKFTYAISSVGKHVAEDLDNYLTGVQRRRQHRYELEERRIRDDAEAKRREDEKRRQEKVKVEAEMQARLEAEKKRAEEALEYQRAAKEAADKLIAKNAIKAAALTILQEVSALTRADGEEKTASSGSFLKAAESALKLKERRSQIYKQVVAETEALRRSVDLRSHELQIARRIRQISWTTESVRGKAIELVTLITNSTYPRSSTLIFAEKIVSQCANPSGSLSKSVFAYAQVIFLVTSQVPQAMDFVLADFVLAESNRLCIYTVPMHEYSESIFKTKEAYYKAIEYC
ncbi:mRNA export factor GLE1-like [Apium graveolens]|uniref:mRNA export factor GLE1-like n=1 Tax=Apium graveolens TaxID=4045 RepID=UPI003D7B2894